MADRLITLGARYIDYGLTGGFFVFLAMALFGLTNPELAFDTLKHIQVKLADLKINSNDEIVTAVVISLFVVCLFATGLLIELIGTIQPWWEQVIFLSYIRRNESWVKLLLSRYEGYLGDDLDRFLELPPHSANWRDRLWLSKKSFMISLHPFRMFQRFRRLQNILISHFLLKSDEKRIQFVVDQLEKWRMSRSIATILSIIMLIAIAQFPIKFLIFNEYLVGDDISRDLRNLFLLNILVAAGNAASFFVVRRASSNFYSVLFASIFILWKEDDAVDEAASQVTAVPQ